jgi:hypothetical protein
MIRPNSTARDVFLIFLALIVKKNMTIRLPSQRCPGDDLKQSSNQLSPQTFRGAPAASIRIFLNDNAPFKGQNVNEIILAAIIVPLFHALLGHGPGVINDLFIFGDTLLTLCARAFFYTDLFLVRRFSAFNKHFGPAVAGPDYFIAAPEGMRSGNKKQTKDSGNEEEGGIFFHPVFHGVLLFNSIYSSCTIDFC